MKKISTQAVQRARMTFFNLVVCLMAFAPTLALAASATVNFGFSNPILQNVSVPKEANTVTTSNSPVFRNIQTSTELDTSYSAENFQVEGAPAAKSAPRFGIGIDVIMSDDLKVYNIPMSYAINRNFALQLNLPIVTAKFDDNNSGGSDTNTGIGDVNLTLKHHIGSEKGLAALYSLLTVKFASGDADKGLGTGSYDISLTEKVIKRIGDFRGTLMFGVTLPMNNPTILGSSVDYGANISYMAALEHTVVLPELWFGLRLAGLHSFETTINGIGQSNALTTLDVIPEFNYYFKRNTAINLGVTVPVYTDYALPGGSNNREIAVNFGVSTMF